MTVLMVSPYAPYRDGIAAYAVQEVRRMRAEGTPVEVLSPLPSAAEHHLWMGGVRGMLALAKRAGAYERVVVQFSPEMIFGACHGPAERVSVWGAVWLLAQRTRLEVRLHEIEWGPIARNPAERLAAARALAAAERLAVHTEKEMELLTERLGLPGRLITLVDHGSSFAAATQVTQAEARSELGLDPHEHVFLSIGFLQEHKGYDLAVEAFGRANLADGASIHVVGSVRVDHPELIGYARHLELLCQVTSGAHLHQKYVSDEEFDRWIAAADTLVLPYREIWSSGVMERAKLFNRAVIAADVGGLGDQAPEGTLFFTDTESLVQALKERAGTTADRLEAARADAAEAPAPEPWLVDPAAPDRAAIERQIRARAYAPYRPEVREPQLAGASPLYPLVALGRVPRPRPVSARPGVTFVKRVIRRVLNWELAPVIEQVETLHRATVEAVTLLQAEQARQADAEAADNAARTRR